MSLLSLVVLVLLLLSISLSLLLLLSKEKLVSIILLSIVQDSVFKLGSGGTCIMLGDDCDCDFDCDNNNDEDADDVEEDDLPNKHSCNVGKSLLFKPRCVIFTGDGEDIDIRPPVTAPVVTPSLAVAVAVAPVTVLLPPGTAVTVGE